MTSAKLLWLASYPKSGNTWLRIFFANLLSSENHPVNINRIDQDSINASDRKIFDDLCGVESSDLTDDEISLLKPRMFTQLNQGAKQTLFIKIHDALTFIEDHPIIPMDCSLGVIYMIRNPLDLAVSFAYHTLRPFEKIIQQLNDPNYRLSKIPGGLSFQFKQRVLTWSQHVLSWVDQDLIPVHLIRYEELYYHPIETFTAAARFAGYADDPVNIQKAIKFSSFEVLQKQEVEQGFREKPANMERFFRKGKVGSWREELTSEQAQRIIADHGEVMRRFGYLTEDGQPVF